MGVLGAPLYHVGAIWGSYWYPSRLYIEKWDVGESPYKAASIRIFKFVWGLPAGTEDPQIQVLDNLPAMRVRHKNRMKDGHAVDSRV